LSNFFKLIQNENMKIFRRPATLVMIGLLIVVVLAVGMIVKFVINDVANDNWEQRLAEENIRMQVSLEQGQMPKIAKDTIKNNILLNEYRIENNIPPNTTKTLWGFMDISNNLTVLITLFTVIVASTSVAGEFSWGTIKLLLIRPASRSKILLTKYISSLVFALAMLVILFVASFIIGSIFFGFGGIGLPYLSVLDGQVSEGNMVVHVFNQYGLNTVELLMMVTFAFMISTVFRNGSVAIGLSIFLMFVGQNIVALLSQYDWVKYIMFANTDLRQYINGTPLVEGMTMQFSLIVLAVYFLIFNLLSWYIFNKRDITA